MRGVPPYRRDGREFPNSTYASLAGIMAWTMEKTVKKFERARQRPVIQSQPMACESGEEDRKITSVRIFVPAQAAPTANKEERGPSLTMQLRDLANCKGRMILDLMVILNERQQQKWAFERKLKAAEAVPGRRGVPPTVRELPVVVLHDSDDVKPGLHAVEGMRSL